MKEKKLPFRKLFLGTLVFLLSATLHAQCPLTMPADNSSWGTANWTRKVYDGNWLLNSAGTAYVTPPAISSPTTEDFGVDDYSADVNFPGFSLPLPTEKVIRVGKKYGQPGQGLLSPVRSAAVATFTFTPTQNNCKIMMYYIGALQESSTDANLYSTVIANFRKDPDNQPASFGLFCRYNYTSPIPNSNTPSRAGKNEFGTVDLSSSSGTFTNNTANVSYGLNDMFSFYQYGTNSDTAPPSFSKVMTGWKSYTMDFSEFIGATVTVTLFANTSNYDGSSQNHSYCYYQFKCLNNQQASTLPTSNLSISYDETTPTTFDLGCFEAHSAPLSVPIQITNTNPTLLGGYSNPTTINNNTSFKWLNLKTNSNTNIFNSNFASVTLELKDASGTYAQFNGISRSGTTTPTLTVPNPNFLLNIPSNYTTSTLVTNGTLYTYVFRVTYTTWKNPTPQIGYFTLKLTLITVVTCDQDPNITVTIGGTNPSLVSTYSTTNTTTSTITNLDYGMCLPVSSSSVCNIKLDAGGTTCASSSYQWQRKKPNDLIWSNIANQTGISLSNAQSNLYTTACATLFRRVNVTSVSSSSGCSASIASESNNTVTIWNKSYMPYTATSTLLIADANSNSTQSLSNVSTGKKVILCYGDQVTFTNTFRLGDLACSFPTSPTKSVTIQIVKNYVNGSPINSSDVLYTTTQNITNNQTSFITNPFSYTAINGAGFNFNGASTFALVPITIVVTSTVEGCSYTNTSLLVTFQIFPRALGGSILASNCPIKVENNNAVPTVAYNSNDGNSSLPTDAYIWSYCTNYTPVPAPTNYECTGTNWTIIPGQGNIELPLAIASILNIPRPFIIKRTAKSGNNCGGMEDTAPIEISNSSRTLPNFTLPSTICLTTDSNNFPVANPAVSGNWYEYTIATTTATPPVQIPTIINIPIVNFNTLAAGAHDFIFIPDTQNNSTNVCYDFVKWHFTLLDAIPQFTQVPPICSGATLAPLPTTSLTGISGSWSPALNNTATTTYYFTPNPENCIPQVSMTIVVNPVQTPTFSLPNTLCVGATAPVLDNSSIEGINGLWTPTTIATAVAGNQNYTFTPTAGQCVTTATTTINITVTPKVTPTFSAMGPYCQNATPGILPLTSNNVINGTWSPATINTASGGTYTYTFTPAAGQCAIATTMKITIIANVIPTFNAIPDVCLNDTPPVLLTSSTNSPSITGTWNSTVSTTTVGTTFYTFTPNAGQCATIKLLSVTVKALPGLGGATSVCMGNTATLSPTSGGIWISSATSVATVSGYTVTPVAPGTVTLSFKNTSTNCTNTKSFTVNALPVLSGAANVCVGGTVLVSSSSNGTWSSSPTSIATINSSGLVTGVSSGSATLTFTDNLTGCKATKSIVCTGLPTVPVVSVSAGTCAILSTAVVTNYNSLYSYNFTPSGPVVGAVGAISNLAVGTSYVISSQMGACVSANSSSFSIGSQSAPIVNALSSNQILCKDTTASISVTTAIITGVSYQWYYNTSNSNSISTATIVTGATTSSYSLPTSTTYTRYYFVVVTNSYGCTTVSNPILVMVVPSALTPTFNNLDDTIAICEGMNPPILLTSSNNNITGTWSPTTVNNAASGNYLFTPNLGQCATSKNYGLLVLSNTAFVANNDTFNVFSSSSAVTTNAVSYNDTYNGGTLPNNASLLGTDTFLAWSIVPYITATPPASGDITFNTATGIFTVAPNTTPGTYVYTYTLATSCYETLPATVTIIVNPAIITPRRFAFNFCYKTNGINSSMSISADNSSLYNGTTIDGAPIVPGTATINIVSIPLPPITINNYDGTFTLASGLLPQNFTFYFTITSNGVTSASIHCAISISSTVYALNDAVTFNSNGSGTYNVLSNDRYLSDCINNTFITPTTSNVTVTQLAPFSSYYSIGSNGGINNNLLPPPGTYVLNYQICDIIYPSICQTATVTITIPSTFAPTTNPIISKKIQEFNLEETLISPNPSNAIFEIYFSSDLPNDAQIEIYDALGKTINAMVLSEGSNNGTINLENVSKGIYLLRLTVENSYLNKILIKN